jgi:hypothetical protein
MSNFSTGAKLVPPLYAHMITYQNILVAGGALLFVAISCILSVAYVTRTREADPSLSDSLLPSDVEAQ